MVMGNISKQYTHAIVYAVNNSLPGGGVVDRIIHQDQATGKEFFLNTDPCIVVKLEKQKSQKALICRQNM